MPLRIQDWIKKIRDLVLKKLVLSARKLATDDNVRFDANNFDQNLNLFQYTF